MNTRADIRVTGDVKGKAMASMIMRRLALSSNGAGHVRVTVYFDDDSAYLSLSNPALAETLMRYIKSSFPTAEMWIVERAEATKYGVINVR